MIPTVSQLKNQLIPRIIAYIDKKLAEAGVTPEGYVTRADLLDILNGIYDELPDDDPITEETINKILSGTYTDIPDTDSISAADFVFV